jgi:pyruvate/2-oxoglutarate dehydrogenase complex dihydrolipoamide acyltransferase (E2) component
MQVVMPQLGDTVAEGKVTAWRKRVGERVEEGEALFDVSTDKVETEVPAPVSGVLTAILISEGTTVKVGVALATIGEAGEAQDAPPAEERLSPVVRKLLAEHGLQAREIAGTGAEGRITRRDVLEHLERKKPPAPAGDQRVPQNPIRKRTAEQTAAAWRSIPHVLQAVEVDFHAVESARGASRELTWLPFVARAVCEAIASFPLVNSSLDGDALLVHPRIHLGIAVDLGGDGLIVPVVKDAALKSLRELAHAIQALAVKARARKLLPDDVTEGTYTISNSGRFGTFLTAPIILPPQVAILSLDGVAKKPVARDEGIVVHPVGVLAQSFDHRAFDGAYSAGFLQRVKEILEGKDWRAALEGG